MFGITESLCIFLAVLIGLTIFKKRDKKYPPGPFSYPVIGNLHQLAGGIRPEVTLQKWAKEYGKIFSIKMGTQRVIIIDDYKMIKEAFNDHVFAGKPLNEILAFSSSGAAFGIINNEGEVWESQRRYLLRSLRDFGFGKSSMETLISEEVKEVLEHFEKTENQAISVDHTFGLAVLNSLWTIACGKRFSHTDPKLINFLAKMDEAMILIGGSGLVFAPWLRHIFPELSGYNKFMEVAEDWRSLFKETIAEHIKTFSDDYSRDFIDQYLREIEKTKDASSSFFGKDGAGGKNLLAIVGDIFLAGVETTGSVLNWTMLYLSSYQNVQEKLQAEIDRVIGNSRSPTLADRSEMPFAEATIMEILRFSSLVPCGAPHTTLADVEFNGFHIPKGTWVMGNLFSVHRNPEIWGDPETFRPERFLSDDNETVKKHEALIPFHIGKRQCLGESLARDTLFLFIVSIFQRFHVKPDLNNYNPKFEMGPEFVRKSKPFKVILTDRLN